MLRTSVSTGTTRPSTARTVAEVVGLTMATFVVAIIAGVAFMVPLVVIGDEIETTAVLIGSTVAGQLAMLLLGYGYMRYRDVPVPL